MENRVKVQTLLTNLFILAAAAAVISLHTFKALNIYLNEVEMIYLLDKGGIGHKHKWCVQLETLLNIF
jgi:hypothetical protein